ncbi:sigma-70 family RNA polymerase sigma factor [Cohnella sp. CFH 77786]|nr:sigma-70 family RNA polymerase sigma factor [Cohnella sp. CFH 77786]
MCRITKNLCLDQIRRKKARPNVSLDGVDYNDPETALLEKERKKELTVLLDQLPQKDKELLMSKYYFEMSLEEISKAMKMSIGAVKSRLFGARLKFTREASIRRSLFTATSYDGELGLFLH